MVTEPPLLIHHLGCGDGLLLAGGAVELAREFGALRFPVWEKQYPSFVEIFKSVPAVEVVPVRDEHHMVAYQRVVIMTGIYKKTHEFWRQNGDSPLRDIMSFDEMFYGEIGVPLQKKWDSFPWKFEGEPLRREQPYVFVHDDASRHYIIDPNRMGRHWTQDNMVAPDRNYGLRITDYAAALLGAAEVHCINSSFIWLRDLLPEVPGQRLFYHRYSRPWYRSDLPTFRLNWEILD